MSAAAADAIVDHTLCDLLYHIEHEGQLPEFWINHFMWDISDRDFIGQQTGFAIQDLM